MALLRSGSGRITVLSYAVPHLRPSRWNPAGMQATMILRMAQVVGRRRPPSGGVPLGMSYMRRVAASQ